MSDIDTAVMDSLNVLDSKRPIREVDDAGAGGSIDLEKRITNSIALPRNCRFPVHQAFGFQGLEAGLVRVKDRELTIDQ